jgi:hypothetical protein
MCVMSASYHIIAFDIIISFIICLSFIISLFVLLTMIIHYNCMVSRAHSSFISYLISDHVHVCGIVDRNHFYYSNHNTRPLAIVWAHVSAVVGRVSKVRSVWIRGMIGAEN